MKTRRMIGLVLLLGGLLASCGLPSAPPPPASSPPPQFAVSPDAPTALDELILYEIEHKRTEDLLARVSPSSLEHYGEPALRETIGRMNDRHRDPLAGRDHGVFFLSRAGRKAEHQLFDEAVYPAGDLVPEL